MAIAAVILIISLLILATLRLGINIGKFGITQILESEATSFVSLLFLILGLIAPVGVIFLSLSSTNLATEIASWKAQDYLKDLGYIHIVTALNNWQHIIVWGGLIGGFLYGRRNKGVHSQLNRVRKQYEYFTYTFGYWFTSPWPHDQLDKHKETLNDIEKVYSELLNNHKSTDPNEETYNTMVLLYQRALLRASVYKFENALEDVRQAKLLNDQYHFSKKDNETALSQQNFLEAELLITLKRDFKSARKLLNEAREIDEKYYDADGLDQIDNRLYQLDKVENEIPNRI